jgi:hypothetical protein
MVGVKVNAGLQKEPAIPLTMTVLLVTRTPFFKKLYSGGQPAWLKIFPH